MDREHFSLSARFRSYLPVVVDVETAGLDPKHDALIEVAMMTMSMDEQGMLHPQELFKANILPFEGANLNEASLRFIGVKDPFDPARQALSEDEALRPMFKAIKKEIKKQGCSRALLVGHNAGFDLSFIMAASERINAKNNPFHPFSTFDTVTLSGLIYGHTVLSIACRVAGIDFDESLAHSAAYDTQKECELFCAAINRYTLFAGFPQSIDPALIEEDKKAKQCSGHVNAPKDPEDESDQDSDGGDEQKA